MGIEDKGRVALDQDADTLGNEPNQGAGAAEHHHGKLGVRRRDDPPIPESQDLNKQGVTSQPKKSRLEDFKAHLIDVAMFGPLVAAVLAPLSTLMDIPALSQNWFLLEGAPAPDPGASLALSAVSLSLNCVANALLLARFTVSEKRWRVVTVGSVFCWIVKLLFALVNLSLYGALSRNAPGYTYDEGFWCAVLSCVLSGVITLTLVTHFILRFDRPTSSGALVRLAGAQFILTVTSFLGVIGIEGLVFSKIEGWTFFQGVYFAIVTAFTIGFGDFQPTYTASRVLLFPFAVLSIALLAAQVGVLVDFSSTGAKNRRSRWRARYEVAFKTATERGEGEYLALVEEMSELQKIEAKEDKWERIFTLVTSTASLVVFWLVGGSAFMAIEGLAFGTSLYFCYVFLLTIGYGDYSPTTPGGRVFFVIYAILAVPVVTNFVVSTISSLIHSMAAGTFEKARDHRAPTTAEQRKFHSHAHNVDSSAKRLLDRFGSSKEGKETELVKVVLGLAVRLEAQATTLLLETLERGSKEQLLLRADRNLMVRALRELHDEDSDSPRNHGFIRDGTVALEEDMREEIEEAEDVAKVFLDPTTGETDRLEGIRRYRETVGGLLAAGSLLMGLDGTQRLRFERRLTGEADADHGGMLLGSGRKGPAEIHMGVDV